MNKNIINTINGESKLLPAMATNATETCAQAASSMNIYLKWLES